MVGGFLGCFLGNEGGWRVGLGRGLCGMDSCLRRNDGVGWLVIEELVWGCGLYGFCLGE